MRTRSGTQYGALGLRSGFERVLQKCKKPREACIVAVRAIRPFLISIVPRVNFGASGKPVHFCGRQMWTLISESDCVRVYIGEDWSITPWDDRDDACAFVARFRVDGTDYLIHVDDDTIRVELMIAKLNQALGINVRAVGSQKAGMALPSERLRQFARNEETSLASPYKIRFF